MIIGVDLGATWTRVALGNGKGRILRKTVFRTPQGSSLTIPSAIADEIKVLAGARRVKSIGIASIGPLDMKKGLISPVNYPSKKPIPLAGYIKEHLGIKPSILNDCVAAVMAEKNVGAGKKYENLLYITISTGIGGGVYVDGHLLLGKDGNAHEIGHITVERDGLKCGCGGRGHWEAYCSGTGIPNLARLHLKRKLSAKEVFDKAKKGSSTMRRLVDEIGKLNAIGIANVVNAYDPELITLGGSIVLHNREAMLRPIQKYMKSYIVNVPPMIEVTKLGEDICLKGALVAASGKFYKTEHMFYKRELFI